MDLSDKDKEKIKKDLRKLSTSDLVILRWHKKRRPNQTCPNPVPTVWWLLGGRGCVAAGTPIWDPSVQEYRSIEKMTEPGWVLTTQGPAIASPSYIKGVASLYRVETETGDVISVTEGHKFLTKRGYIRLSDMNPDDEINSLDPLVFPLISTWEKIQTIELVGEEEFYDIHVPGPNNYLAAGMFHHNSGKTYSAANHIFDYAANLPFVEENETVYVALIGAIFDDVKNTMIEGRSGILKLVPEEDLLKWNRTVGELSWRVVGPEGQIREVECRAFTSEKPDKLRGPNIHLAWVDEYSKFKDANEDPTRAGTTWNNMMLGLRLGTKPHVIVTGTPTDCKLSKFLLEHPSMKMSHMTTLDNRDNLPDSFFDELMLLDPGSRTYRQEVLAELIFDNPDAIFTQEIIDNSRATVPEEAEIVYKVLGYDPSVSSSTDADECGIILCAYTPEVKEKSREQGGRPRIVKPTHAYILDDLSGHYTPHEQTQLVIQTILNRGVNDLVFEQNQGVEFVMTALEQALKDNVLEYTVRKQAKAKKTDYGIVKRWAVSGINIDGQSFKFMIYAVHATSQKKLRAEMVSTRYDSGQIHHPETFLPTCEVNNCRASLESQMTSWDPKNSRYSPDRLDAMAYCMLHIFANFMITRSKVTIARPVEVIQKNSQHQAIRRPYKGLVGVYSTDFDSSQIGDMADRSLIPHLDDENYRENPYGRI